MYEKNVFQCYKSVHPHGCGEHTKTGPPLSASSGSSPRVWGTSQGRDIRQTHAGSSPRVWGTFISKPSARAKSRFIPTGVGNIALKDQAVNKYPVHPHGCGEHNNCSPPRMPSAGSSPRVWGTCHPAPGARGPSRFIPTGVGNIWHSSRYRRPRPVHPHGCGEHDLVTGPLDAGLGSSPRVWGTSPLPTGRAGR